MEATTGGDGLRLVREMEPDLVLLDAVLPDIDSLEVCRQIKADAERGSSFVVLLSAFRIAPDDQAGGLEAGADGYIARPISSRELLARVQAMLRLKRAEDHQLGERVKELNCLYSIRQLVQRPGISLEEILQGTVDLIPVSWQYPEVTCARIILDDQEFRSDRFQVTPWCQAGDISVGGIPAGRVEVFYLEERPTIDEGPFLKEERDLINAIALQLGRIVDRVQAEKALRESEERYRVLSELSSDLTYAFRVEPDGSLVREWLVGAYESITGFSPEELDARGGWARVIHLDDQPASQQHVQTLLSGQPHEYELRIINRSGQMRWLRDSGWPELDAETGRVVRIYGAARDITERRRAEEALRQNEKRYRQLLEALQEGIWVIDQDARATFVNPRMAEMLGYTVEEMQGLHLFDFMDVRGVEITKRNLERRQQGIKEQHDFEFLRKDGSRMYASLETSPIFDDDGNYAGGIAGIQDITERVKAEQKLRASEEKYRDLVEKVSDVIYTIDTGGMVTYISPAIEAFIGYHPSEVVGRPYDQFVAREDLGRIRDRFRQLASGVSLGPSEHRLMTKSGKMRWVQASSQPILEGDQVAGVRGVLTDITDRVQAQQQLEEMAAVAERERLARELHDAVTQALFSTCLIADTLSRVWEQDREEGRRGLEELNRLTHGALAEMRTLLLELRPAALEEQRLDILLPQLTDGMMARTRISFTTTVAGDCSLPTEIQIALYRIAQESLNNITKHSQASQATVSLNCQPDRVSMHISDNGRGFNPEDIQPHQLGISIMRERAQAIGATLSIKSQPGQGTELLVTWPDDSSTNDE
jgi:PAS domain S-box-containing protein